jgi:hypothetical protein
LFRYNHHYKKSSIVSQGSANYLEKENLHSVNKQQFNDPQILIYFPFIMHILGWGKGLGPILVKYFNQKKTFIWNTIKSLLFLKEKPANNLVITQRFPLAQ